jgi:hypothetical protein
VDRVGDVLVGVRIREPVVVEVHRAVDVVADEPEPEAVIALDGRATVDVRAPSFRA